MTNHPPPDWDDGFSSRPQPPTLSMAERFSALFTRTIAEGRPYTFADVPPCVPHVCHFVMFAHPERAQTVIAHIADGLCDGLWYLDDFQLAKLKGGIDTALFAYRNEKHPPPVRKPFDQVGLTALPVAPTGRVAPPMWRADVPREYYADRADPANSDAATIRPRTGVRELRPEVIDDPRGVGGPIGPSSPAAPTPAPIHMDAETYAAVHGEESQDGKGIDSLPAPEEG